MEYHKYTEKALIRVSNQGGDNRHTLTHEFGHALGLQHIPINGSTMSGPNKNQLSFWSGSDIATIAAIQDVRVLSDMSTLTAMCNALGVNCTDDLILTDGSLDTVSAKSWGKVAIWMKERSNE